MPGTGIYFINGSLVGVRASVGAVRDEADLQIRLLDPAVMLNQLTMVPSASKLLATTREP